MALEGRRSRPRQGMAGHRIVIAVGLAAIMVGVGWAEAGILRGRYRQSELKRTTSPSRYRENLNIQILATNGNCKMATSNVNSGPAAGNDKVYITYMDNSGGCGTFGGAHHIYVKQYDYTTGNWTTEVAAMVESVGYDGHEAPSIFRDARGYLWVFYGGVTAGKRGYG